MIITPQDFLRIRLSMNIRLREQIFVSFSEDIKNLQVDVKIAQKVFNCFQVCLTSLYGSENISGP